MKKTIQVFLLSLSSLVVVSTVAAYREIISDGWLYWVGDSSYTTALIRSAVTEPIKRCNRVAAQVYQGSLPSTQKLCVENTQWGSVSEEGFIRIGSSINFAPLDTPEGWNIIWDAGATDRIYFERKAPEGYELAFLDDVSKNVTFDITSRHYKIRNHALVTTIDTLDIDASAPYVFRGYGFSKNGNYLVGIYEHFLVTIDLSGNDRGYSIKSYITADLVDDDDAVFTPTVSNNGLYIALAGANFWKLAVFEESACRYFDRQTFDEAVPRPPECDYTMFSDATLGGAYPSNPQFNSSGTRLAYNIDNHGTVNEMSIKPGAGNLAAGGLGVSYIALGDSYASGEGDVGKYISGTDGTAKYPQEKCHVGRNSYSARLSGGISGEYFSVACSGATVNDVLENGSYPGQFSQFTSQDSVLRRAWRDTALDNHTPGRIPQSDFVAEYHPKVITLGIGGNNIGFKDNLVSCILSPQTCDQAAKNRAETARKIEGLYDELRTLYKDTLKESPGTELFVVGYPQLIKEGATKCSLNVGLDGNERRYINETVKYLNQTIKTAAYSVGAHYVDVENAFGEEALCGNKATAMNGVEFFGDGIVFGPLKLIKRESYHPTARGHELIAQKIKHDFGDITTYHDPKCASPDSYGSCRQNEGKQPVVPEYFRLNASAVPRHIAQASIAAETIQNKEGSKQFSLSNIILKSFSSITLRIRSDEQLLGTYTADENGLVSGVYTLPSNLSSGYHTLILDAVTPDGEMISYQQVIYVIDQNTASDAACFGVVPDSGIDQDGDGIDDACDGQITVDNPYMVDSSYDNTNYGDPAPAPDEPVIPESKDTSINQQTSGSRYVTIEDMLKAAAEGAANKDSTSPSELSSVEQKDTSYDKARRLIEKHQESKPSSNDKKSFDTGASLWLSAGVVGTVVATIGARMYIKSRKLS